MKTLLTLLIAALYSTMCFAQADSTVVAEDTVKPKATLTLGASYSNNANYYGQKAEENIPYAAISATYRLPVGLYITGMAYNLLNDTGSLVSASSAGAGFGFNISKKLSADISYSHTFYPSNSPFLQAANADNASASLTYDNFLSTTANVDYAFGKTQDVFVTLGTGKFINLGSLFSKKDFISITPSIDVTAGTQHFYETYVTEKRIRDSVLGLPLPPIFGNTPGNTETTTTTKTATNFDILSYNFKFPLAYNRGNYLLEVAYQLSALSKKVESGGGKTNSFFTASFYYQF
jgi:hypothetical protein